MVLASQLLAAALLAWASPARADAPPPSDAEISQIIEAHRNMTRDQILADHAPEPYLGLPSDPGQRELLNKTFGAGTFERTHIQTHFLLKQIASEKGPPEQTRQKVSGVVAGVRTIIGNGLRYAGIVQSDLPPEEKKRQLEPIDQSMDATETKLEAIPLKDGKSNAGVMLNSAQDKFSRGVGVMNIMTTVQGGFDKIDAMIKRYPAIPALNVSAGDTALSQNNPTLAKKYYDDTLSIDPGNADALAGRAAANLDLKNMGAAAQDARDALRLEPDNEGAKAVLGLAHDALGGDVTIDKDSPFKQQEDAEGTSAAGRYSAGSYRAKGLATVSGAGLQSSAYTREALRALSLGDAQAALKNANRAISLDPKNADAYGLRAFAQARAGHYDEALKDAVAALALDPGNTMAQNARAKALNQMGMFHEALAASEDAIRANPRNAYAYYMKAMAENGLGDRKAMLAALGQAAALDARYQDAYDLAKSAPDEKDLAFLFPEDQLAAARAAMAARPAGPRRYFGLTAPALGGAAALALGLLSLLLSWLLPRLRGGYAAAVRTGPSLGAHETMAALPTPAPFSTQTRTPAGTVLRGQYRRLGQIGSSVHGAVYEGMDQSLERRVVIRKLRADMRAADRERLLAPARAAAKLAHAGIAPVYAVFEDGDALYLVSEFAPGRTLRDWLAAKGPLTWEEARPLFAQVAAAVDHAHDKGVAHGAIKASNIMISSEGRAKLLDYGLARGPADAEVDLNSFAACLREAIAGLPPARLDALDAALLKTRGRLATAAQVLEVVEAELASAA